ncbi:MAG: ABC transporter permease, partial [Chloroflexi bacterium]
GSIVIVLSDPEILHLYRNFFSAPGEAIAASISAVASAYGALLAGSLGSLRDIVQGFGTWVQTGDASALITALAPISESLVASVPLIFASLAVALGFRCGLFNIGAEGQLLIGATASVWVGYSVTNLPWIAHMSLAVIAGALAGAIWGAIPGYLKARTGAHEVITTIMMNWIAIRLIDWLTRGPMARSPGIPKTREVLPTAYLPQFSSDPRVRFHAGFLLALGAAALVYWFLFKTTLGFEIRTVGANPDAARYSGISVSGSFVLAMAFSGGLAGLAGTAQVLGVTHFLAAGFSPGFGFDSIALALLGKSHPVGVVLASLLFGSLRAGATKMQSMAHIPVDIIAILQALIIMFVAAPEMIRRIYRIRAERVVGEQVFTRGWGAS